MRCHKETTCDGFLNLLKPPGVTSHDLVRCVRRLVAGKVGHTGTLDPAAAGVMVVSLGRATRLSQYVQHLPKTYRAEFTIGVGTDTHDAEGTLTEVADPDSLSPGTVQEALQRLTGQLTMAPPAYSAAHVQGRRAYELARAGRQVQLSPRVVEVQRMEMVGWQAGALPQVLVDLDCSTGTYVRSLAVMLGEHLGTAAYLSALLRTAVGQFRIEQAATVAELKQDGVQAHLVSPAGGLAHLPAFSADVGQVTALLNGNSIGAELRLASGTLVQLLGPAGDLIAVAECLQDTEGCRLQPRTVLAPWSN